MIDVIIPAYNCTATLDRTLGSLVAQFNKNFKVTIVDDCSTEDIKSIIDKYTHLLNIKYVRNEKNMRCGMSRQVGIDNSEGEYFTFLDSDDTFMPYTISVFYENIERYPEIDIFNSYFYSTDKNDKVSLIKHGITWCHGRLYKRSFIEKYGIRNNPKVKYGDDSYFNSMCDTLNTKGFMTIPIPMMVWINNNNSITRKIDGEFQKDALSDFIFAMNDSIKFLKKYVSVKEMKFIPGTVKNILKNYIQLMESKGKDEEKQKVKMELKEMRNLIVDIISPDDFNKIFNLK